MRKIGIILLLFLTTFLLMACDADVNIAPESPIPKYSNSDKIYVSREDELNYFNSANEKINTKGNVFHSISYSNLQMIYDANDFYFSGTSRSQTVTYYQAGDNLDSVRISQYTQAIESFTYEDETTNSAYITEQYVYRGGIYFNYIEQGETTKTNIKILDIQENIYLAEIYGKSLLEYSDNLLLIVPDQDTDVNSSWYQVEDDKIVVYTLSEELKRRYFSEIEELFDNFDFDGSSILKYDQLSITAILLYDQNDEISAIELIFNGVLEMTLKNPEDASEYFTFKSEFTNSTEVYYFDSEMPEQPDFSNYITFDEYNKRNKNDSEDED